MPVYERNYKTHIKMKRINSLTLVFLVFCSGIIQAQEVRFASVIGAASDTVSNTATKSLTARISGYRDIVAIQPVLTKISGTTAGTVRLFGSIDGVNFSRINTADSLVATNVAEQSKVFVVPAHAYEFYRITYVGSGSHSTIIKAVALTRKK